MENLDDNICRLFVEYLDNPSRLILCSTCKKLREILYFSTIRIKAETVKRGFEILGHILGNRSRIEEIFIHTGPDQDLSELLEESFSGNIEVIEIPTLSACDVRVLRDMPNLRRLHVEDITEVDILLENCPRGVRDLALSGVQFTYWNTELSKSLPSNLESLKLSDYGICGSVAIDLCAEISHSSPRIVRLDLSNNRIREDDLISMAYHLGTCKHLTQLNVNSMHDHAQIKDVLASLASEY